MRGNRLGCGLNHSIVIGQSEQVFVWGRSINDELGVPELKGFVQNTPYLFQTTQEGSSYTALEVACGESHTALLLKDNSLPKLKLIFHPVIDISRYFQAVIEKLSNIPLSMSQINAREWGGKNKLSREQITEFFHKYCDEYNEEVEDIIDLLMKAGDSLRQKQKKEKYSRREKLEKIVKPEKEKEKDPQKAVKSIIPYKEFRDQLYGTRLDDGRVLTWGNNENGKLGRPIGDDRFVRFTQDVSITKIACGGSHCLAISSGRKLYTWGTNSYGQLGVGDTNTRTEPVLVSIDAEYLLDVAGGGSHSMALSKEGEVFTWGLGEGGRLGHGDCNIQLHPKKIEKLSNVESVAAGHSHSGCIIKGEIYTWGIGTYARLGHGSLSDFFEPKLVEFFKGRFMEKLCLSFFHSVVLSSNGEVWAWGNSKNGRLGIPTSFGENQLVPVRIGIGSLMSQCKIIDIACGYKHGLALAKSGHLFVWGCGLDGKLGIIPCSNEEPLPKEVKFPKSINSDKKKKKEAIPLKSTEAVSISCSYFNTYTLTNAGQLIIWGGNTKGQCGVPITERGDSICKIEEDIKHQNSGDDKLLLPLLCSGIKENFSSVPLLLEELKMEKFKQFSSNGEYAMGVSHDGKVYVWGSNDQGQLGTGFSPTNSFNDHPVQLVNFKRTEMKNVSCGPYHSAFLAENGEVYVCGSSENGRLGLGENVMNPQSPYQYIPRVIFGLPNIKKISCGVSHTVAIDYSHGLWSWGGGWFGKLGLGNSIDQITPQQVQLKSFYPHLDDHLKDVACGEHHTLLLSSSGHVYAAGLGIYAGVQLMGSNEVHYFNRLSSISQVRHISVGRDHSVVVTNRGQLYGWGRNNYGKLGEGRNKKEEEVIECRQILVKQEIIFDKVACGSNHSAALTTEGAIYVWGATSSGRLGLGSFLEGIVKQPTEVVSMKHWFRENDEQTLIGGGKVADEEEQYLLQSMLKNEPVEQNIETLLAADQNIVYRLENLLNKFSQVRSVQEERENMLSYIESLIVAKIESIPSISNPDFKLTLPPIISKNFQLYEFLLACMQTHPCYMAKLVEHNPHLPTSEVAGIFKAIYGDMSNNPQKLRRLMLLYKLVLKISVANTDFQRSLKMKAGDISAYIYFYLLQSQQCNNMFYSILASEIMKIVRKASLSSLPKEKEKIDAAELAEAEDEARNEEPFKSHEDEGQNEQEEGKDNDQKDIVDVNKARMAELEKKKIQKEKNMRFIEHAKEGTHKIRDALNFKQLEELGDLPPELKAIYDVRKALYIKTTKKVKKKIKQILTHDPKVRKRITLAQKLSDEVKFMYKDIPSVFRERFKEQCNSTEGQHILDSKIVMLFFAPLVEMLREPIRLKRMNLDEFDRSMGGKIEKDKEDNDEDKNNIKYERPDFEKIIKTYATGLNLVADYIEDLGEWKKAIAEENKSDSAKSSKQKAESAAQKFFKQCKYRNKLVQELTNVPDLNLTDLSLGDMLSSSLENDDSALTISLEDLCQLHMLLFNNLKIIKKNFGKADPVFIIIKSLGKVKPLFQKILSGDTKTVKLNLRLPIRWLLREKALQSCRDCKTPLTYSLLKNPPPDEMADVPLTVPTLWRCWSCGNTQDGWHMKCAECSAIRRHFPEEALFKNFQQTYISPELEMFTQILYEIPPVPPSVSPYKFILDIQEKQQSGTHLLQKLKVFKEILEEIGNSELDPLKRAEDNIQRLENEAKFEYNLRASHKAYLDSMNTMLGDIEDKIKLICLQFNQNTIVTLRQASIAVAKGKNTMDTGNFTLKNSKRAQGRFTVDYLFKKHILDTLELPESIKKNTSFYFTEVDDGAFDVRVVLREDRNYLCLPRDPIEVKIMGFSITVDKLKAMRRTMNFRAQTSFENGKVTFNVFQFVRMLGSLLGKCKQADF